MMTRFRDLMTALQNAYSVQELDAPRKKIRELSPEIGCLKNLERLNLGYNKLKELPSTFRELKKLKYLDLSNNLFKEIPQEVFELQNLEILDLRYNRVRQIAPNISRLQSLTQLSLRANIIEKFPCELAKLPNLKFINLYGCVHLDWEQIVEILTQSKSLESLDLSLCRIKKLPENFSRLVNLKSLNLSNNPELDLVDTIEKLSKLPKFEEINLTGTQKHLPDNLNKIQTLTKITFDRFSENEPVLSNIATLKCLDASYNRWHKIPQWVFNLKNLEQLILKGNKIETLPPQIEKLCNLKVLDLNFNNLRNLSLPFLRMILQLEKLDLEGNRQIDYLNISRFKEALEQADLGMELKKALIGIFAGKMDLKNNDLSLVDLVKLLSFKISFVRTFALAMIEDKLPTKDFESVQIPAGSVLYLAGKSERYAIKDIKPILKERNITLSKNLDEKVTHIVLSQQILNTDEILKYSAQYISDSYLQNKFVLPKCQTAFDTEEICKLKTLLRSSDTKNNLLALQLMTNQGVSKNLYAEVTALAFFSSEAKIRQTALKLIYQYYPTDFQALIKWLENAPKEKKIRYILKYPTLNKIDFVNLVYENAGIAKEYIIQWGGTCFEKVVKESINYSDILSLRFNICDISPEIEKLTYIKKLEIIGHSHKKNTFNFLPEVIFRMTQLEYLRVDESQLKEISPNLANLINLKKLRFTESEISHIPDVIARLKKLEILSLFNNKIQVIPEVIGELSELQELWVFSNRIKALPPAIGKLKKLRHLHLSSNQLETLPAEIGDLENLEELSLSDNPLKYIPPEIAHLKKLKRLELGRNPYVDIEQKQRLKALLPNCNIQLYK